MFIYYSSSSFSIHNKSNQNILSMNHLTHAQGTIDQGKRSEEEHNPRPANSTPSYASVLTQGASQQQSNQSHSISKQQQKNEENDPFAAIRELGQRSNGLYNYFQ